MHRRIGDARAPSFDGRQPARSAGADNETTRDFRGEVGVDLDVLFILVPLGVGVALASALAFWRAASGGQFDDLDGQDTALGEEDDEGGEARAR